MKPQKKWIATKSVPSIQTVEAAVAMMWALLTCIDHTQSASTKLERLITVTLALTRLVQEHKEARSKRKSRSVESAFPTLKTLARRDGRAK